MKPFIIPSLCLAFAISANVVWSQKSESQAVFTSDTRLVVLHATVVDKSGHLVTTLPQNAFQVFENGVQQQVKLFKREDVPVSMGLVIDNSGSMRDKRQKVAAAALALVKASNREDEVFVVNFNDDAFLDCDFTNKIPDMEQALTKIDSRGGTAMRDAIRMSIDHLKEKAKRDKKVILVVTDGNDNASIITLENLVKLAQQAGDNGVIVYAVGLLNEEERREAKRAKRALDALTEATGGQAYYPKELADVDRIAHQVAHDIRNQYTIAYTPSNVALDGSFRQIRVTANGPGRPTVRTRTGYYATPELAANKSGGS
ncbi:MAG TPA: VWA domain-containing protein [Bryobacteraceae bacterium]|nr:VWA domain-containing protein [Bryobacteraceae bacterium]